MTEPVEILMIEDNDGDVLLTQQAFKSAKINNHISVVGDGVEALEFLRREGKFANAPQPDLIFLDLNLPRKDGREVLAEIKQDPELRSIPVIVLTSSKADQDIARAYDLQANAYVTKPVGLKTLVEAAKTIEDFWLTLVKLPPKTK